MPAEAIAYTASYASCSECDSLVTDMYDAMERDGSVTFEDYRTAFRDRLNGLQDRDLNDVSESTTDRLVRAHNKRFHGPPAPTQVQGE